MILILAILNCFCIIVLLVEGFQTIPKTSTPTRGYFNSLGTLITTHPESKTVVYFRGRKQPQSPDQPSTASQEKKSQLGWFQRVKRFLPDIYQSWIRKGKSLHPRTSVGQRYHVQLVLNKFDERPHLISCLRTFLPDISVSTANQIVEKAFEEGRAVIRIYDSLERARDLTDLLRRADPPVLTEIYDFEKQSVLD